MAKIKIDDLVMICGELSRKVYRVMEFRPGDIVVLGIETSDGRIVKAGKVDLCSLLMPAHEDLVAAGYDELAPDSPPVEPPKKIFDPTVTCMGLDYFSLLANEVIPPSSRKK